MKIRIGGLEIVDATPEELDELIKRYGGGIPTEGNGTTPIVPGETRHGKHSGHAPADAVLLKRFVDGSTNGITLKEVGELLGRRGKATRKAAKAWALRVNLTNDDNLEVFDDCRIGTQRGYRIKQSLLPLAQELLKGQK